MIFLLALLANFVSLFWVVKAHKTRLGALLKNPAFLVGDFLLIPIYFSLVAEFLTGKMVFFSLLEIAGLAVFAFLVVIIMGKLFCLLKFEWFFHGLVAWSVVFTFLLVVVYTSKSGNYFSVVSLGAILGGHQALGLFFPKKL